MLALSHLGQRTPTTWPAPTEKRGTKQLASIPWLGLWKEGHASSEAQKKRSPVFEMFLRLLHTCLYEERVTTLLVRARIFFPGLGATGGKN